MGDVSFFDRFHSCVFRCGGEEMTLQGALKVKSRFYLITSLQDNCEVEVQKSPFCPTGSVYLMTDKTRPFLEHVITTYQAEKEKSEWIRRYDNVLQGLNYWKSVAAGKK